MFLPYENLISSSRGMSKHRGVIRNWRGILSIFKIYIIQSLWFLSSKIEIIYAVQILFCQQIAYFFLLSCNNLLSFLSPLRRFLEEELGICFDSCHPKKCTHCHHKQVANVTRYCIFNAQHAKHSPQHAIFLLTKRHIPQLRKLPFRRSFIQAQKMHKPSIMPTQLWAQSAIIRARHTVLLFVTQNWISLFQSIRASSHQLYLQFHHPKIPVWPCLRKIYIYLGTNWACVVFGFYKISTPSKCWVVA